MGIGQALIIAASGFLVVFIMLVLLWVIIGCINKVVSGLTAKKDEPVKAPSPAAVMAATGAEEQVFDDRTYGGEIALYGDMDDKTVACIMAIVSDETKIPLSQLIFKSIRELQ